MIADAPERPRLQIRMDPSRGRRIRIPMYNIDFCPVWVNRGWCGDSCGAMTTATK